MSKPKKPQAWRATVNLDRLEADTGRWKISTGKTSDPLPREIATDPAVRASIVAWMSAHGTKTPPAAEKTSELEDAIRLSVTTAFRARPPVPVAEVVAPAPAARRRPAGDF